MWVKLIILTYLVADVSDASTQRRHVSNKRQAKVAPKSDKSRVQCSTGTDVPKNCVDPLFISAFNVQRFGKKKMTNPQAVKALIAIIRRYDLTIIQEIQSVEAFRDLVGLLNQDSNIRYASYISPPYGSAGYKEMYGYIYNPARLGVEFAKPYSDVKNIFFRKPFIVKFRNNRQGAVVEQFNTIVSHVRPCQAVAEVSALADVYDEYKQATPNAVILGDLNADCNYIKWKNNPVIKLRQNQFSWKIPDTADTTVSSNTRCAYDRIVTAGSAMTSDVFYAGVYNFKQMCKVATRGQSFRAMRLTEAKAVSDHYPVEFYMC